MVDEDSLGEVYFKYFGRFFEFDSCIAGILQQEGPKLFGMPHALGLRVCCEQREV